MSLGLRVTSFDELVQSLFLSLSCSMYISLKAIGLDSLCSLLVPVSRTHPRSISLSPVISLSRFLLHSLLKTPLIFHSLARPVSRALCCLNREDRRKIRQWINRLNEWSVFYVLAPFFSSICRVPSHSDPVSFFSLFPTWFCALSEMWYDLNQIQCSYYVSLQSLSLFCPIKKPPPPFPSPTVN